MRKQLIILSESASFPWGMAAANRVRNLARALIQEDWAVEYVSLRGAEVSGNSSDYSALGVEAGILYTYPGRFTQRPKNWWLRRIDEIFGWIATATMLIAKKISRKVDAVIIYSRNDKVTRFWIPFLHIFKVPVILEMCEWPLAIAEVNGIARHKAERYCRQTVPEADAVLPISTYIEVEIAKMAAAKGKKLPSFKIPILIDVEIDSSQTQSAKNGNFILYCGSFNYMDIAKIVVDIAHSLRAQNIHLPIIFTGKENVKRLADLKIYAKKRGVEEYFTFTGFIEESELHLLMQQALCLLAPLPDNLQSESRFSTKIGYYLASGTPVVTNSVGDVSYYLCDGENAYIADQCDPGQYAVKIVEIMNNPESARKIGQAGKALAFTNFHYTHACKGLGDFIGQVVEKYTNS